MKKFGIVLAVVLGVLLAGCGAEAPPVSTQSTGNQGLVVDVIGKDQDGYTIKRFRDSGYDRYYITPGPARMEGQLPYGKTTFPNSVDTMGR